MPNPNYIAGRNAEWNLVRELRNLGYEAQRSAASHGIFDVYGIDPTGDHVIFIQSKRGGKPSPSDYQGAIDTVVPGDVIKLVVWFPVGKKPVVLYWNRLPIWLQDVATGTAPRVAWTVGPQPVQPRLSLGKGSAPVAAPVRRPRRPKTEAPEQPTLL